MSVKRRLRLPLLLSSARYCVPLLLSSAFCIALPACDRAPAPPPAVSTTVERGPYVFTVSASPSSVPFGDPIDLTLSATTPAQTNVQFDEPNDPNAFAIVAAAPPQRTATPAGDLRWTATYELWPQVAGELTIPPATLTYADQPDDPDALPGLPHALTSDALKVQVASALDEGDALESPRDITGVVLPPEPFSWRDAALTGLIAGLVVGPLAALYVRWRRRARRPPPPIAPDVWALQQLAALDAAELVAAGRQREFYYRLSEVVRGYVERRFAIAAPEMTTPEFLSALLRAPGPLAGSADRLRRLLEACDAVKYAALDPGEAAARDALAQARAFVADSAATADSAAADQPRGGQAA